MQTSLTLVLKDIPNKRCRAWLELREPPPAGQAAVQARWWVPPRKGKGPPSPFWPYLVWEELAEDARLGPDFWQEVLALVDACKDLPEDPLAHAETLAETLADFWGWYGSLFREKDNCLSLIVILGRLMFFVLWVAWYKGTQFHERTRVPQAVLIEQFLLGPLEEPGSGGAGARFYEVLFSPERQCWPHIPRPPEELKNDREAMVRWTLDEVLRPNAVRLLAEGLECKLDKKGMPMSVWPREPYILALLQVVNDLLGERPMHACPCGCGRDVPGHKKYFSRNCMRRFNTKQVVLKRYRMRKLRGTITPAEYEAVKRALNAASKKLKSGAPAFQQTADTAREETLTRWMARVGAPSPEETLKSAAKQAISRLRRPVSKEDGKRRRLSE